MVHLRLGDDKKAEKYIREAIHTYEVTCGETSPLTGGGVPQAWAGPVGAEAPQAGAESLEASV